MFSDGTSRSVVAAIFYSSKHWFPTLAMAGVLVLTLSQTAAAEPEACQTHREILAHFAKNYRELPAAVGITDGGNLIEVLSTREGATWSIIVTTPNGMSCLVAAGESWRDLRERAADDVVFHRE